MTRVRYLAALGGAVERRSPPSLRPPRRLFAPEPLLERPPAFEEGRPDAQVTPPAPVPAAPEPSPPRTLQQRAERDDRAVHLEPPFVVPPPVPAAPPVRTVEPEPSRSLPEPVELEPPRPLPATAPARSVPEPPLAEERRAPASAPVSPAVARSTRAAPVRVVSDQPHPTSRERSAEQRAEPARPPVSFLTPPDREPMPRVRVVDRPRAAAEPARAPSLHIGSIEVTVVPPPVAAAAVPPAPPAQPPPARHGPAPFEPRAASTSRSFGLAQR